MMHIRRDIRLKEYDYSNEGIYFITICTKDRKCILSKIDNCRGEHCSSIKQPILSYYGKIVEKYIINIEQIYLNVKVDEYIIMPNHVHIILTINEKHTNTVSTIIQQLKGKVSKELEILIWQKLFYEHVIRNDKEYLEIKKYIINNPINWSNDIYCN